MKAWKDIIVGTAGHVDHGKSALIHALTGTDPDRLPEEKRRGMTIDLGFAHCCLEDKVRIGFVDVPGHRRFVKNMLAGAGGIDAVFLVVAANESIKPQTQEHFEICRLLGVRHGIVVISKTDLVDFETVSLVELEVREMLKNSPIENAPIIATSIISGAGLDRLKRELAAMACQVPSRSNDAAFRLPIDRAFSVKGFGTVVTGSLQSGAIQQNDEVEIQPSGKITTVRYLQVYGQEASHAVAGQRVAVNLQNVSLAEVERGMELTLPKRFHAVQQVIAKAEILPGSPVPFKNRMRIRVHYGTGQVHAVFRSIGGTPYIRLAFEQPTLVLPHDRLILRRISPWETLGGAIVLDVTTQVRKGEITDAYLTAMESSDLDRMVSAIAARRGPLGVDEAYLLGTINQPAVLVRGAMRRLLTIVSESPLCGMDTRSFSELCERTLDALSSHHRREPLSRGISMDALLSDSLNSTPFGGFVLQALALQKKVAIDYAIVRLADYFGQLSPVDVKLKREIEDLYQTAEFNVPTLEELFRSRADQERVRSLVNQLIRDGVLIRVSDDLLFHSSALKRVKERILAYKKTSDTIDVVSFKNLLNVSRKYAIPLLGYLDRERITRRVGDSRMIQ